MKKLIKAAPLGALLLLAACGGGGGDSAAPVAAPAPAPVAVPAPTPAPAPKAVSIEFAAVAGSANTPVDCSTLITGLGSVPTDARLTDLRLYLTDVALIDAGGQVVPVTLTPNDWQQVDGTRTVTLIDLEDGQNACGSDGTAAMNNKVVGTVPDGTYVKVIATVAVPQKMSHSDVMAAAAPLDIMAMGWSWQAGRKFIKMEVNPVGGVSTTSGGVTSTVSTYNLHLASTDCSGPNDGTATCNKNNYAQFTFDFDAATQKIAIDVAEVFKAADIRVNQNEAVGCMSSSSDADCPAIFGKFGLDVLTGVRTGAAQTVFRPIAK